MILFDYATNFTKFLSRELPFESNAPFQNSYECFIRGGYRGYGKFQEEIDNNLRSDNNNYLVVKMIS